MHRRADDELTTILEGGTGGRRPDARDAQLVLGLRSAFRAVTPPPPSTELASLLNPTCRAEGSARRGRIEAAAPEPPARASRSRRQWVGWLAGLSLAGQLGVGSTAALAAVGGVGVAGVLPAPAQDTFDRVVTTVTPFGRDEDAAGMQPPAEGPPASVDRRLPEETSGRDEGSAPADPGRDGRSRRDERGKAKEQAVPDDDHRAGTPEAPGPGFGQPGASGSEGSGSRTKGRAEENGERTDDAADEAADEADEAKDKNADADEDAEDAADEVDGPRDDR